MKPDSVFDPKAAAKKLLREARSGALATLMAGSGDPYCSLVNVATAADGAPLLLISQPAVHTKNILADPRVSLMLDERKPGDPLEVTICRTNPANHKLHVGIPQSLSGLVAFVIAISFFSVLALAGTVNLGWWWACHRQRARQPLALS